MQCDLRLETGVDLGLQQQSLLSAHRSSTKNDFHPIPFACYSTATSTAITEQTAQRNGATGTAYRNVMLETRHYGSGMTSAGTGRVEKFKTEITNVPICFKKQLKY